MTTPRIGREVAEWRSDNPDAAIPTHVKARIRLRCDSRCALTGKKLRPGDDVDYDHIVPLADGGAHAEFNLQLVWRPAHRKKTAAEAGPRAKTRRIYAKHHGLKPKSKGFRGWRNMRGEIVWRDAR